LKRRLFAVAAVVALVTGVVTGAAASGTQHQALAGSKLTYHGQPIAHWCNTNGVTCTEPYQNWEDFPWYNKVESEGVHIQDYIGHDEPSVLFYSNKAGSGNNNTYNLVLPKDPPLKPTQDQSGGTWNFQLHPAFWFGMVMCDDQSAPNPTFTNAGGNTYPNNPCTPDSNTNIYTSSTGSDAKYVGKHPGVAFMEMQFYPPGWVKWPEGNSCDATRWCAALNIDSLSENMNDGQVNNSTCLNNAGIEPVNFAYLTKTGVATTSSDPLNGARFNLVPSKDFFMNSGDKLKLHMFDTSNGFTVQVKDVSAGTTGKMVASVANGFASVHFDPTGSSCTLDHHAFHPAYSTTGPNTTAVWAAHSYNVAYSDEIGHFEYCAHPQSTGALECNNSANSGFATNNVFPDTTGASGDFLDMNYCLPAADSSLIKVGGCVGIFGDSDVDFDGAPYDARSWPGSMRNQTLNNLLAPTPIMFTTPTTTGGTHLGQVAFETDLSRIEDNRPDGPFGGINQTCQRFLTPPDTSPGTGCFDPPPQARFYPFYSTTNVNKQCWWQEGGAYIPGTVNRFGGEIAEYGNLLAVTYPEAPAGTTSVRYNDFHHTLSGNPCT
jgi:hypothetical protein